jgi:hypothetical protein
MSLPQQTVALAALYDAPKIPAEYFDVKIVAATAVMVKPRKIFSTVPMARCASLYLCGISGPW